MTGYVFQAIENRFNASQQCKEYLREIFRGHDGEIIRQVLPYCLVDLINGGTSGDEDTIGTDGESCHVVFELRTKREVPDVADRAFEAIRYTFDGADISYGETVTCNFRRIAWDGPKRVNIELDSGKLHCTRSTLTYLCEFQLGSELSPPEREA